MRKLKIAPKISEPVLNELESDILNYLWKKKRARVREVYTRLKKKRDVAHSSIAVILDRMHKRGHVKREIEECRGGFRYVYYPSMERIDFERAIIKNVVDKIIKVFGRTAISYFDEKFGRRKNVL